MMLNSVQTYVLQLIQENHKKNTMENTVNFISMQDLKKT